MHGKLKIGIILNQTKVSLWVYRVIEKIMHTGYAEIMLVILDKRTTETRKPEGSFLYRLHLKTDRFLSRKRIDFDRMTDAAVLLQGVPSISYEDKTAVDDPLQKIHHYGLDILLNFSLMQPMKTGIPIARYGIWNYQIESMDPYERPSNGYWELVKRMPDRRVIVNCTDSMSLKETILFRSCIPASLYSVYLNLDRAYNLSMLMIPRILKEIYEKGPGFINSLAERNMASSLHKSENVPAGPANIRAAWNMLVVFFRYGLHKLLWVDRQRWFIACKHIVDPLHIEGGEYMVLKPPRDRFWADPFVINTDHSATIFMEELMFDTNKGHISVMMMDHKGKFSSATKILEKEYHLSFPFIFEHNNRYYMIPETSMNRTIQLYRCEKFPDQWTFVMNLMENKAAMDSVVFFYNQKWWLFTAVNESSHFPEFVELFIYYSNDIFSANWTPHPANPVVSDIRNARPAGKIFVHNNQIYRPSQDCSGMYGKAYHINQITNLTENDFQEVLISKREADWGAELKGTHTFNFDNDVMVTDAFTVDKRFYI